MKTTRAGAAAIVGLLLTGAAALAAAPQFIPAANVGAANAAQHNGVSESPQANETPEPTDAPEAADAAGAQGTHGAAVSTVARGDSVGGKHNNHGGAVSAVARGNHGKGNGHHPLAAPTPTPTPTPGG